MKVPQRYMLIGLGIIIIFIVVLHYLGKKAVVPHYELEEKAKDWIDEKDPVTGL